MNAILRYYWLPILLTIPCVAIAQDTDRWQSLAHDQFVKQAARDLKSKKVKQPAVTAEAKRRLVATDALASASYPTIDQLTVWGAAELSDAEKAAAAQKLQARADRGPQLGFGDIASRYDSLAALGASIEDSDKELLAWIDAHELGKLEFDQVEWLCFRLGQNSLVGDRLQVEWTGFVRPEKQGQYKFSPSRICTDRDWGGGRIRSAMKVTLDGTEIINTVKNGWQTESQPLLLDNSRDLPIRVTLAHDRPRKELGTSCPGVAMLCWSGPGIPHQLVPTTALKPADGNGHGLTGQYTLSNVNLAARTSEVVAKATRLDPQIDLCWWRSGNTGFRPHCEQRTKAIDELVARYGNPEFLTEYRRNIDPARKRELDSLRQLVELATLEQRKKLLAGFLASPQFVESLRLLHVRRLQHFLQPGPDEDALALYSIWFPAQKKDPQPQFTPSPQTGDESMRSITLDAMMLPGGINFLRDHCVARSDGTCCLGAAYVVAYGAQWEGKLDAYCQWLDEKLGDLTLGGDRRVGWLIARSIAEGLRGNQLGHHYINNMQGWAWLEEAFEAAETEPVKLQVARYQATRLLDAGEKSKLRKALDGFESLLTSDESRAELKNWRDQLRKFGIGTPSAEPLTAAERSEYLTVLNARAKIAESRGDADAIARYRKLIAKLEAK